MDKANKTTPETNLSNFANGAPATGRLETAHGKTFNVTHETRDAPATDHRKMKGAIVAIAALVLTIFTGFGGALLVFGIKKWDKKAYTGFKYVGGVFFNAMGMYRKDLTKSNLVGDAAKQTDSKKDKSQSSNTVTQDKETGHSIVLSDQLTQKQVEDFADLGGTTVVVIQEEWEQVNEKGLKQFAKAHDFIDTTLNGVEVRIGTYKYGNGEIIYSTQRDAAGNKIPLRQILIVSKDHEGMTVETLDGVAKILEAEVALGHVDVHCKSGRGRSAQAHVVYLMRTEGLTVEAAIEKVSNARRFADVKKANLKALFYEYALTKLENREEDIINLAALAGTKEGDKLLKAARAEGHLKVLTILENPKAASDKALSALYIKLKYTNALKAADAPTPNAAKTIALKAVVRTIAATETPASQLSDAQLYALYEIAAQEPKMTDEVEYKAKVIQGLIARNRDNYEFMQNSDND